jgi:SAM-dependent methyltransferase
MVKSVDEIIELNKKQAVFYDSIHEAAIASKHSGYANNQSANFLTRTWASLRNTQHGAVGEAGIQKLVRDHHTRWIEELAGGDFLEVGCFSGSADTMQLVHHSRTYLGVELSPKAVEALNEKFASRSLEKKASAISCDFLTMSVDRKFDLIYAHGVLHHFENSEALFSRLFQMAKPGAILLFVEPVSVNPIYKAIRSIYRPFQSDAAWEWPFSKSTIAELERHFVVESGFGWGKWSLLLSVTTALPIVGRFCRRVYIAQVKREVAQGWHPKVWHNSMVAAAYRAKAN